MSKTVARGTKSYEDELLLLSMLPGLLESEGFASAKTLKLGGMKFLDAEAQDGSLVRFWVKQGWTDAKNYCAIQFGLFKGPGAAEWPNNRFIDYVDNRVKAAQTHGATHALLVHMIDGAITNFVALELGDVTVAYKQQIEKWPKRARNTKTPTLWFEDDRNVADAPSVTAVTDLEVTLPSIAGKTHTGKGETQGYKKVTAEVERRMKQQLFRALVGAFCNWRCAVTGTNLQAVLDAAHLPGKDWRYHNAAEDGILVRTDIHRLLDSGLAEIRNGRFWLKKSARVAPYANYHNQLLHG